MKHTFKKFTAALAAAVMCALPAVNTLSANAYANDNARYTFRKTYIVTRSSDIDAISFSWNINSNGNSAPQVTTLVPGEFMNGGTGVINHHIGAGSFFPTNPNVTGPVFTQSFISNTNTPTVYGNSVSVFKTNGQIDNSAIVVTDKFLVGDLDKDGDIDAADREIVRRLHTAILHHIPIPLMFILTQHRDISLISSISTMTARSTLLTTI